MTKPDRVGTYRAADPKSANAHLGSLTQATLLRMAIRISLVIIITSLVSYFHLMHKLEEGMKEQLVTFAQERARAEGQWLEYIDRRLQLMRTEFVERYQRLPVEPAGEFDRWFKMNADGSAYTRSEFYSGASGPSGARYTGFSGGIDKTFPLTADRRTRLVLSMQMLAEQSQVIVRPATTNSPALTPFVDLYFYTPEKDLVIYWPGTPWYPDYKNGFDLAAQGDFSKTIDTSIPLAKRDRLWTGTYMDEVPKVWMVSFTMPIDFQGKVIAGLGTDISLAEINARLRKDQFKGSSNLIMRSDGQLIAAPQYEAQLIKKKGDFNLAKVGDLPLRDAYRLIAANPGQSLVDDPVHDRLIAVSKITGPNWLFVVMYPKSMMSSTAVSTVLFIFFIGVLSLLIEVGMLWIVLRRQVVTPLQQFIAATHEIAHGNLSPEAISSLPVARQDEIGHLADSFLQMSHYLSLTSEKQQHAEAELRRHRDALEETVTERTRELMLSKAQAEEANRAKSVFLANMSHELRTPLNAILGFAQLLSRDRDLHEESRRHVATIRRAGQHLLALINDVLDISRVESGRSVIEKKPFDLGDTLISIEEMIRGLAQNKGLIFQIEHASDLPVYVDGDGQRIKQILINLLGNAIKYTERGSVQLRVEREQDTIRFEVADTGPGIDSTDHERIFQPFYQTAEGIAKGEGTGLGLAISREYAQMMGGTLSLKSRLGFGCVFTLSLPLPEVEQPVFKSTSGRVVGLEDGQTGWRILVVDDKLDNRELVKQLLEKTGFEVRTAKDGQQALTIYQDWQPSLIWMDMRMPVLDGYAATQQIRALPAGDQVKIVALTASAFEEDRQRVLDVGCDAMVRKPLDEDQLFELMGELLGIRYRYAEIEPDVEAPSELDLSSLPPNLLKELKEAADDLDLKKTEHIVMQLQVANPELAVALNALLQGFRFDQIAALCSKAGNKGDRR